MVGVRPETSRRSWFHAHWAGHVEGVSVRGSVGHCGDLPLSRPSASLLPCRHSFVHSAGLLHTHPRPGFLASVPAGLLSSAHMPGPGVELAGEFASCWPPTHVSETFVGASFCGPCDSGPGLGPARFLTLRPSVCSFISAEVRLRAPSGQKPHLRPAQLGRLL